MKLIPIFLTLFGWCSFFFLSYGNQLCAQQNICAHSVHQYSVDESENNGEGSTGSQYQWQVLSDDFLGTMAYITNSGNQIEINWGNTPAGEYILWVEENDENGCADFQELEIIINPSESWEIQDYYLCPDQEGILVEGPTPMQSYEWTNELGEIISTQSTLWVMDEGNYSLTVNTESCPENQAFEVIRTEYPNVTIAIEEENDIWVNAVGGAPPYEYQLINDQGMVIRPWQNSPIFQSLSMGNYQLLVRNDDGFCFREVEVNILPITNIITPNDDGNNDVWDISSLQIMGLKRAQIFDRYGKLIVDLTPLSGLVWDGKYLGRTLPSTTYWYIIEFENGKKTNGSIQLKNF